MPGPYTFPTDRVTGGPAPADDVNALGAALNESDDGATASVLVLRDAAGRAQFADPVAVQDVATKGHVDGTRGRYVGINAQTGTAYTPVLADQGKLVTCTNAAAITVTLPSNATVAFLVGAQVDFAVLGAGLVTFVAGSGATANGTPSLVARAQYSAFTAIKVSTNGWLVVGDLA